MKPKQKIMCTKKIFVEKDKYQIVGDYLNDKTGSILDVGSRDKILLSKIKNLDYKSADLDGDHDYLINLENSIPIEDYEFDYVVALDVLEHVGNIHEAFDELLRVTKGTFIMALPNMASYRHRFSYFFNGQLNTDKYALWRSNRGDRHRWLTIYEEILGFVDNRIKDSSFIVEKTVVQYEGGKIRKLMVFLFKLGIVSESFVSSRVIFFIKRTK